jgi:hypothetical protein
MRERASAGTYAYMFVLAHTHMHDKEPYNKRICLHISSHCKPLTVGKKLRFEPLTFCHQLLMQLVRTAGGRRKRESVCVGGRWLCQTLVLDLIEPRSQRASISLSHARSEARCERGAYQIAALLLRALLLHAFPFWQPPQTRGDIKIILARHRRHIDVILWSGAPEKNRDTFTWPFITCQSEVFPAAFRVFLYSTLATLGCAEELKARSKSSNSNKFTPYVHVRQMNR